MRRTVQVRGEVLQAPLDRRGVHLLQRIELDAAVHLERPDRGDQDDGRRVQDGRPAFQVEELLAAQVEGEAGLCHSVIGGGQGHSCGQDRVATVGDVSERAAVDERRSGLGRLDQVRQKGLVEDGRHRAGDAEVLREDLPPRRRITDEDAVDPRAEVARRIGQAEDGHDFAGRRDVESRLAGHSLGTAPQPDDDVPQRAVVHVQGALPQDARGIEVDVAKMEPVVDRRGEQVVSGGDRVEIARELEVDRVRRLHAAGPASSRASLATEDRTHRRLAERQCRMLADPVQPLGQPDRGRRLPLTGRRRRDRRDQDQTARRAGGRRLMQRLESDLRLVPPVGLQMIGRDLQLAGHLGDRPESRIRSFGHVCDFP